MFTSGVELFSALLSDNITEVGKPESQRSFSCPLRSGRILATLVGHFVMHRTAGG
jgi:hypothetical protein